MYSLSSSPRSELVSEPTKIWFGEWGHEAGRMANVLWVPTYEVRSRGRVPDPLNLTMALIRVFL